MCTILAVSKHTQPHCINCKMYRVAAMCVYLNAPLLKNYANFTKFQIYHPHSEIVTCGHNRDR